MFTPDSFILISEAFSDLASHQLADVIEIQLGRVHHMSISHLVNTYK